jgi:3-hydroxy-3-methylglutaryl CoA synthase
LIGKINYEPLPLTQIVAKTCQKEKNFQDLILHKLEFGLELTKEMGNIYSGSVFGWLAAGLEDAIAQNIDWTNKEALLFGYGSGDAAEVIPISFVDNWQAAASKVKFSQSFGDCYNLSHGQYMYLRSKKKLNGIDHKLNKQFVVKKIGTEERDDFQDAGIEYYEYLS